MKKTPNFALSQWDPSDRIRMEDFNNDNLQMDNTLQELTESIAAETAARKSAVSAEASARTAAVQAETAARNSAIAALEQRSTLQVIKTVTLSANNREFKVDLTDINWGQYREVIIVANLSFSAGGADIRLDGGASGSVGLVTSNAVTVFFPLYQSEMKVVGLSMGNGSYFINGNNPFSNVTAIRYYMENSANTVLAGSKAIIYGLK